MPIMVMHTGNVTVIAPPGRILQQVAADIMIGITEKIRNQTTLHVGAHALERSEMAGLAVGIQTEQMFDENGKKLWNAFNTRQLHRMVSRFDAILDLSHANAPAYSDLPIDQQRKVRFGPYIFPEFIPQFVGGSGTPVFYGTPTNRRKKILRTLVSRGKISMIPRGTFGEDLAQMIASAPAVVNIHIDEGVYTEYPRLLNAYLNGKVIISERLAGPLVAGKHYADIMSTFDSSTASEIYRNFSNFAQQHKVSSFLIDATS